MTIDAALEQLTDSTLTAELYRRHWMQKRIDLRAAAALKLYVALLWQASGHGRTRHD